MKDDKEKESFIEDAGDIITAKKVTESGFHRSLLSKLVDKGEVYKVSRGIYLKKDAWEDEMYLLQKRYSKGIFSYETALFLHLMTDRTPQKFSMTFPRGYNSPSIKNENVIMHRVIPENYELGIVEIASSYGNTLKVYDIERTLCDIVKGNNICDIQIVNQAMKKYATSKDKDVPKLIKYAKQLRVKPKIVNYMEILL